MRMVPTDGCFLCGREPGATMFQRVQEKEVFAGSGSVRVASPGSWHLLYHICVFCRPRGVNATRNSLTGLHLRSWAGTSWWLDSLVVVDVQAIQLITLV